MATEHPDPSQSVSVPVVWVGAEELPVHFANAFVGVVSPGEIFLTVGSIVPPGIVGATPAERGAQARAIPFVQAKPVARLGLTPDRLDELIRTLQETQALYVKLEQATGQPEGNP